LPPDEKVSMSVLFKSTGHTYCGSSSEIIGCRADAYLTEYNTRDYRFSLGTLGVKPIGSGPVEVPFLLVLTHEMGHWIGLRHIDIGQSIMSSSLETARCIDDRTISALARYGRRSEPSGPSAFVLHAPRRLRDQNHGQSLTQ
jgi:hypothetical protein